MDLAPDRDDIGFRILYSEAGLHDTFAVDQDIARPDDIGGVAT
jgi:hypothetical protein